MNKKLSILKLIIWSVVAIYLTGLLIYWTTSGSGRISMWSVIKHDSADMTVASEHNIPLEGIKSINLQFRSENIIIKETDERDIKIVQLALDKLDKEELITVNNISGNLEVKHGKLRPRIIFFGFGFISQNIEVYIPKNYNNDLFITSSSGSNKIYNQTLRNLTIKQTSGSTKMEEVKAQNIKVDLTSGSFKGDNIIGENLDSKQTSGSIKLNGEFNSINLRTTSGSSTLECNKMPEKINAEMTSGSSKIYIPENDGFKLQYNKTSGSIKSDFDLTGFDSQNRSGNVSYKNGGSEFYIKTTSGSVRIYKK